MTRITQRMLTQSSMANLQHSLGRTEKLQERLSTGRAINRPSDSPTGTVSAMQTRSSLARKETHLRSADNARAWLDTADSALQGSSAMLRRARDLVIQGANTSFDDTSRRAMAMEIESIRDGLLEVANTRYGGRAIFAGNFDGVAFMADGNYQGDTGAVNRTIGDGQQIQINMVGSAVFGSGPDSVFAWLTRIADDLVNDQPNLTANNLDALDAAMSDILSALGEVGARSHRLEGIQERGIGQVSTLKSQLSQVEDVDLPETIMELQMQEVAYQSALAATARVLQPSLLDFLR